MQDDFMPTLTMDEYADIYRRAYRRGAAKNCDPTYRRLVSEAIAAKKNKVIASPVKEQK